MLLDALHKITMTFEKYFTRDKIVIKIKLHNQRFEEENLLCNEEGLLLLVV